MQISAVINTYNAEETLDKCLNSIRWVDEIIIVDMFSSDKTLEIAGKYKAKIYTHPFVGYVELVRNFAISKAVSDWIIIIDSDEYLPPQSEEKIRSLIRNSKYSAFLFPRRNYVNNRTYLHFGYFYPDYQLRLFRNNNLIEYTGKIHIQPQIDKRLSKITNVLEIYHNFITSKYRSIKSVSKFIPYAIIEAKDLVKSNISIFKIIQKISLIGFKTFYRSFIKLKGYKDGYYGLRAAVIYSFYKEIIYIFALYYRINKYDLHTL